MKRTLKNTIKEVKRHKIALSIIVVVIIFGAYKIYTLSKAANVKPQYVVSSSMVGKITQTVAGTGQITATNQVDVTSLASGAVTSIAVKVGQHVSQGDLLATIDDTTAKNSLANAKLSLAQLVEPAKFGDLNNAKNTVDKAYSDGLNSIRAAFTDLQTVVTGLNNLLYTSSGFFSLSNSTSLNSSSIAYRDTAGKSFDAAKNSYDAALLSYSSVTSQSSKADIEKAITTTGELLHKTAAALQDMQAAVAYVATNQLEYHPNLITTTVSNISSWISTINGDTSSVLSANNTIASSNNTYKDLVVGPDELAIQAAELSVKQAEQTYSNYFVRAPFSGVVGRIPVTLYSQAGGSTVIATIIGNQKIANISLDEVDAAKVQVGQTVKVTLDAISDLNATGTVSEVDLVGTVSQGVVSYNVKVAIVTEDDRIRPGMSVNVTIITNEKTDITIVPTAAVKKIRNENTVSVLDSGVVRDFLGIATRVASSSYTNNTTRAPRQMSLTVPSSIAPVVRNVVIGISDETNTEIISGIDPREWVVTKTIAGGGSSAAAPSILSAIGSRAGSPGTTVRTGTNTPRAN